ncbi:hypothetical protein PPTG_22823 [Phytophthora nicotianae INRA-310]|uniref:DUF3730 domain-containing protein n=1 Tax=Phytophthora nicotianae (strain INRA-310) TaxID=761204 RepID=W2QA48_PHYN3|nr:hypothetical protein PPTG_22823 [Phytophthora nicotianae INRA-310]ETN09736.1 hypothetical protein PPTG_22823 [Phytophthora nicotianae INRA-310]
MTSCLYSLAGLAATTTDTMRIILRLIDSMNGTAKMRSMALKLMFEVWRNESRVFPRLEAMLLESTSPDEDIERHVVKMATIKALCEKDPELGVQFISSIQGFLEDELQSVVAMAMDAITALCGADCLDFYVAFKIISQKMRKNKVTCTDEPLFQERLCCFYALGSAECTANEKNALKLLNQAWEFADSEHSSVRKAAYAAMCKFPLDMLGLCMPDEADTGQDSDDEDQMTEEEVEEQLDDLMQRLQSEHVADVRAEIEKLMARVIKNESSKLTAGVGRGQRMASAASQQNSQQSGSISIVSAAATKEMKALLPSRAEVQSMFISSDTTDLSGFLLAYQPKAVIDTKNVKRKDKLVRLATQNVDELVETVTTVLQSMELPWASTDADTDEYCKVFLRTQGLMEGWRGFMSTSVLGAIARSADGFYVSQKKKSFDVEIRTLPSSSLLVKTLEWLRQTNPLNDSASPVAGTISETSVAVSLLGCLTSTGSVLPLLDYASLTHRVMLRFCSIGTSVACVKFAATQGSCDELLAGELLSSRWFGNADAVLQAELISWIAHAATRVPTDVLRAQLTSIFDILKDIWRRDTSSSASILLFDSWTVMLHDILEANSTRRIPESSVTMVNEVILEKMIVEIPFGPHASSFVEQFATRVLSKVDYGERGCADTFLMPAGSNSFTWSWWRNGIVIVQLAKLNVLTITKRVASLAFQWILRHDFEEWTDDELVDTCLHPLVAEIGALIAQHTKPAETVSSLLDVIDAFSRGMSTLDTSVHAIIERRALFDMVANVLSWKTTLIHEQYLRKIPRSDIAGLDISIDLLPFGLIASAQNSKAVSALGERLLALLQQMTDVTVDTAGYIAALQGCSRQIYVAADRCFISSIVAGEIRELWSLESSDDNSSI